MKRICAIIFSVLTLTSLFTGCATKEPVADKKTLNIEIVEKGYGRKWLDDLIVEFKKENPGVEINVKASPFSDALRTAFVAGASSYNMDLCFTIDYMYDLITKGSSDTGNSMFADITDVYNSISPGENRKVIDKLHPSYRQNFDFDGKNYLMPWVGGMEGLIYNKSVLDKIFGVDNYKLPRTTNELIDFAKKIKAKDKPAFIRSGDVTFWYFAFETWWAQYQGIKDYLNFFKGIYTDYNGETVKGPGVFLQDGRLEALKVMEELVKPQNGLELPRSNGLNFSDAQVKFLKGDAAMMPNGDWLENEMRNNFTVGSVDIRFMKTPIISSLGKKLGLTEEKLIQVIDYADGTSKVLPTGVTDEVVAQITNARKMVHTISFAHQAFIPAYSKSIPLAKKFLTFFASDKAQVIYATALKGNMPPFDYDIKTNKAVYDSFTPFQKSKIDILRDSTLVYVDYRSPLVYKGGLGPFTYQNGNVEFALSDENAKTRKTATELFDYEYGRFTGANASAWSDLITRSGLGQ
jgi:ABC-type glycerol-3-phosphate transport system substrate-binding protein